MCSLPAMLSPVLQRLEAAQATAKAKRAGMWRYGDVGDSDLEKR